MYISQTLGPLLDFYDTIDGRIGHMHNVGFKCFDVPFYSCFKKGSIYFSDDYMKIVYEYKEAIKKYDMRPVQAHEPEGNSIGDDNGEYYMKKTPRALEMAAKIGCPSITVHPGHANTYAMTKDEFTTKNIIALKKLLPYAEEFGIEILLENIEFMKQSQITGFHSFTAQDLMDIVDEINHPLLCVNWDVGHAHFNGLDEYEEMKKLGKRIHGVHIHDNLGFSIFEEYGKIINGDMHVHPFFGNIKFDDVIKALIEIDYKGTFNFEVGSPKGYVSYSKDRQDLKKLALDIKIQSDKLLYLMGRLLLEKYNIFEG